MKRTPFSVEANISYINSKAFRKNGLLSPVSPAREEAWSGPVRSVCFSSLQRSDVVGRAKKRAVMTARDYYITV